MRGYKIEHYTDKHGVIRSRLVPPPPRWYEHDVVIDVASMIGITVFLTGGWTLLVALVGNIQ